MISVDNEANDAADLTLELLATSCTSGTCPTIFKSDRGTLLIQGYAVDAQKFGVMLAAGELLVEIPAELLAAAHSAAVRS